MIARLLFAAALALPLMGCARGDLVYDPYRHDYHRWDPRESGFYRQWETGSNLDHVDFPNRTPGDQLAYWQWRHQ